MKCIYTRDIDVCMVTIPPHERENVKHFRPNPDDPKSPIPYWPKGTIREGDFAVWNCKRGFCEPADDECREALGYTPEQIEEAKHRYQRIVDGIRPEDFAAYDFGAMLGYAEDGSWIPGPRWNEYQAAVKQLEESEDI